jgi:hypothetical protein
MPEAGTGRARRQALASVPAAEFGRDAAEKATSDGMPETGERVFLLVRHSGRSWNTRVLNQVLKPRSIANRLKIGVQRHP